MLEIKEEKFPLRCFGQDIEIRYPTGEEVERTTEKSQTAEKGKELSIFRELFVELGMPQEMVSKLQIVHYQRIFEALVGKKN